MQYWLMKSEPNCFSIDDLAKQPGKTTHWDGVRNYQARNMMRDEMKKGDLVFFYHSNAKPTGIVGIAEVIKEGYPDHTAFDPTSEHPCTKSTPDAPLWYMVDIKLKKKFNALVPLSQLKQQPELDGMQLLRKGCRLSVMPVEKRHWEHICMLAQTKP